MSFLPPASERGVRPCLSSSSAAQLFRSCLGEPSPAAVCLPCWGSSSHAGGATPARQGVVDVYSAGKAGLRPLMQHPTLWWSPPLPPVGKGASPDLELGLGDGQRLAGDTGPWTSEIGSSLLVTCSPRRKGGIHLPYRASQGLPWGTVNQRNPGGQVLYYEEVGLPSCSQGRMRLACWPNSVGPPGL